MASVYVRCAAVAVWLCAVPVLANPVLNLDGTDFRAKLSYNDTQSSSSEPDTAPLGQSCTFIHDNGPGDPDPDPGQNLTQYPNDQIWGILTWQEDGGSPLVGFEFQRLFASSVLTQWPLTIALGAMNSQGGEAMEISGSVFVDFEIGETFMGPWELLPASGDWTWTSTGTEYDLDIDFAEQTLVDRFGLETGEEIDKIRVSFDVVPEPETLAMVAGGLLVWRRRQRR